MPQEEDSASFSFFLFCNEQIKDLTRQPVAPRRARDSIII